MRIPALAAAVNSHAAVGKSASIRDHGYKTALPTLPGAWTGTDGHVLQVSNAVLGQGKCSIVYAGAYLEI